MDKIVLETARTVDRDQLRSALEEDGFEARPLEEDGVPCLEVPWDDCDGVLARIEAWLVERELPFVPESADGRVILRPPGG